MNGVIDDLALDLGLWKMEEEYALSHLQPGDSTARPEADQNRQHGTTQRLPNPKKKGSRTKRNDPSLHLAR